MKIQFQDAEIPYPMSILKGYLRLCGLNDIKTDTITSNLLDESKAKHWNESDLFSFIKDKLQSEDKEILDAFNTILNYQNLRNTKENILPIIILIEGASATGKSMLSIDTIQTLSSTRFISTDTIRQVLRNVYSSEEYPELHCHTYQAFKYRESGADTLDPIIRGYIAQCELLTPHITNMMKRIISEGAIAVVEGVHIQPGSMSKLSDGILELLINPPEEVHEAMFVSKSEMGKLKSVTSNRSVREEEFNSTRVIQEYMLELAKKHDVVVVELEDYERTNQEIRHRIIEKMRELIRLYP